MSSNWLTQLAAGHAPSPAGWWPPAPGWWGLALIVILLAITLMRWVRDPRRALRRAALRQLRLIRSSDADGAAVARAIQNLLRRYALAVFEHERVAKLTGEAWLEFVATHGGQVLTGYVGRSMLATAFGNQAADDREKWLAGAEAFVRRARREQPGRWRLERRKRLTRVGV